MASSRPVASAAVHVLHAGSEVPRQPAEEAATSHPAPHPEVDLEEELEWEEWNGQGSFGHHMVAGSMAGVAEHLCMFPVDTYKTHLQAGKGLADSSFVSFVRREGMVRLWRGAPAVLLGCIPSHAAYFSAYELGKETLGVNAPGHHPLAAAATGALATMLHDGILTPMDVMKQRLQLGYYNGLRHCIQQVAAQEGIAAFWRSYPTTLLMNMPYAACVVAANESFKKLWLPITGADSVVTYLLSGAGAGAIAAALTCPLDVIKTRLQTASLLSAVGDRGKGSGGGSGGISTGAASGSSSSGSSGSSTSGGRDARLPKGLFPAVNAQVAMLYTSPPGRHQRLGAVDIARALWAEEGVKGFFRGARARMAVHTPSQAISWAAYETAKAALVKLTGKE